MSHDNYDDGLVHPHGWAKDTTGPATPQRPMAQPDHDHDDGLVHSHGWACGERGRGVH
jgi:hypothetical protein